MTRRRQAWAIALVTAASLVTAFASAQSGGAISGRVLDATTRLPVAGAAVGVSVGATSVAHVITDREGAFVLFPVPAGTVMLRASKANYTGGGYRARSPTDAQQPLVVAGGADLSAITLLLWKDAALTGRVLDDRGDPLVGTVLRAIRVVDAEPRFEMLPWSPSAATDDRGVYRFSALPQGRYVIALPSVQPRGATETGVPTVYYPFASSIAAATVLTLRAGETRERIDLRAEARPGVRLSGSLTGLDQRGAQGGGANSTASLTLHLMPADAPGTPADCDALHAVNGHDGHFMFSNVPPGRYLIRGIDVPAGRAETQSWTGGNLTMLPLGQRAPPRSAPAQATLWVEESVVVGTKDVENVTVPVHVGRRISGRFAFEGGPITSSMLSSVVSVRPADGRDFGASMPVTRGDASGAFQTIGLPAGPYRLLPLIDAPGWVVRSVLVGGRDLGADPIVLGAADIGDVMITVSAQNASVSGVVRAASGATAADASVYVFSTDTGAWTEPVWSVPQVIHEARGDERGAYRVDGLVPGEYFVAVVAKGEPETWRAPAFLAAMAKTAMKVTIGDREQRIINLAVRSPR